MKINPKRLSCAFICLLFLSFRCVGQASSGSEASAIRAQPSDLHLVLSTKEGRTKFYLGEIIDLDLAYSSSTAGKYVLLTLPSKIHGHPATLNVTPNQHLIDRYKDNGFRNMFPILHANCSGVGGGVGGGCADCDADLPLTGSPIHFPNSLTAQFQITEPGRYIVQAESDDVILAPLSIDASKPIQLTSNRLEIEVVEDPAWSEKKLQEAVSLFEEARTKYLESAQESKATDSAESSQIAAQIQLQSDIRGAVETMRVLDTEASLRKIIQLYDGTAHDPDYFSQILWPAAVQSTHRSLAIMLVKERMLEPDFAVSMPMLDQLTAMELENQVPDAFSRDDNDYRKQLYPFARQILQEHIMALGDSLPNKNADALPLSLETFKIYSMEHFCTDEPLIPSATTRQMLKSLQAHDSQLAQ